MEEFEQTPKSNEEFEELSEQIEEDLLETDEVEAINEAIEIEEEMNEEIIDEVEPEIRDETPWIFFDYSGTLVDTVQALANTYTKYLGKDFSKEQVKSLYKDYPKMSKLALMRKYKFNPLKYIFGGPTKLEEIRKEEFWNTVKAFPGIPEVLLRLEKIVHAKFAIVTHETELENEEERVKIFQKFGIPIDFDGIITDMKNKGGKYDVFIAERGIQYGFFIGDTQFDLDLGKKHNFKTIGVTWGFSTQDELSADYIVFDPRELLQIIMTEIHNYEMKKQAENIY
ncbi:MAG: HAD family hydrolase [Asgard group archaeon]|nr:HAD family hydrolase [Asgard group archaeon]